MMAADGIRNDNRLGGLGPAMMVAGLIVGLGCLGESRHGCGQNTTSGNRSKAAPK